MKSTFNQSLKALAAFEIIFLLLGKHKTYSLKALTAFEIIYLLLGKHKTYSLDLKKLVIVIQF